MGVDSLIGWTHATFNPWIGCDEISDACDFCYARDLSEKRGWAKWGPKEPRHHTSAATWKMPYTLQRKAERTGERYRVFCGSLCDVADNKVPIEWTHELRDVIYSTPNLDWLLLSKRPQNYIDRFGMEFFERVSRSPQPSIWLGCTAENQEEYDRRRKHLFTVPAAVHFFSVEPMLGPVIRDLAAERGKSVWYICGGESGPHRRPFDLQWAEDLRASCAATGTPFYFKQDTAFKPGQRGRASDALWNTKQFPVSAP